MPHESDTLRLDPDGAQRHRQALTPVERAALTAALADLPPDRAGVRIAGRPALTALLAGEGSVGRVAARTLGPAAHPVRAVLFDKSPGANWALGWHQDRTIAVTDRRAVEGFGPWSVKAGLVHVAPPWSALEGMLTLRVHLDPVGPENAPLLIAPGSHRLGPVPVGEIAAAVARCGRAACLADLGDIWAYATPILHASEAVRTPTRRRVLQVDYATGELPGGLAWAGV